MSLEEDMLVFLCVHFSAIELFVYEKKIIIPQPSSRDLFGVSS